jgi:WD40 repeat protein
MTHISCLASFGIVGAMGLVLAAPAPPGGPKGHVDQFGDPLPDGALFRIGTIRLQHGDRIERLALSADKQLVASQCRGTTRIWNVDTGREVRSFANEGYYSTLSPTGSVVLVNTERQQLSLYDVASGQERLLPNAREAGSGIDWVSRFSADGAMLATADYGIHDGFQRDCKVIRWAAATGNDIGDVVLDPGNRPRAFSSDLRTLVTESKDHTFRIWDAASGKKVCEFRTPCERYVFGFAFSPDGKTVAIGSDDGTAHVYETATGKELNHWKARVGHSRGSVFDNQVLLPLGPDLAFSADNKVLAVTHEDATLRLWDWAAGRQIRAVADITGPIAFSADGALIAAGGADHGIRFWNVATGKEISPLTPRPGRVTGVVFSPDGRSLIAGLGSGRLVSYDFATGRETGQRPGYEPFMCSKDGRSLLASIPGEAEDRRPLAAIDLTTGQARTIGPSLNADDVPLGWSPDGRVFAVRSGRWDTGPFTVWDRDGTKPLRKYDGSWGSRSVACSSDGRTVAILGKTGGLHLVEADTGKPLRDIPAATLNVTFTESSELFGAQEETRPVAVAFSPDSRVVFAGTGKAFGLWEVATGKELARLDGADVRPGAPAFSADANRLALLSSRNRLCVADATTGKLIAEFRRVKKNPRIEHVPDATAWAIAADGRLAAAAYHEGPVIVWDAETGRQVASWEGHIGRVSWIGFSPDGNRLVTLSEDGTALVWDVAAVK